MSKKALILSVLTFSLLLAACRLLIVELTATPETIIAGEESTLTWNTTNAQSCVIEPDIGIVALNGTITVTPTQTTTYTITATGVDGATVTNSVTVTVNTPAPVVSITAEPGSIVAGKASTLTWNATNADTVNIDPDIGDVAASGTVSVSPTSTTTYTITATGAGGTTTDAISVSVAAAPADVDDGLSIDAQQGGAGLVGETVCILNGNSFDIRTDLNFQSPNSLGLSLFAVYNSRSDDTGASGYGWSHSYELTLDPAFVMAGITFLKIKDNTGRGIYLTEEAPGHYEGAFNERSHVREESGNFVWYRLDGSRYIFSASGKLYTIEDEKGNRLQVSYNAQGDIANITDQSSGRTLTFTYNAQNMLESITGPMTTAVPSGIWVTYQYDANQNLTSVTYADGSGFVYGYGDPNDTHNLMEKRNTPGHLISTWSYDSMDRCLGKYSSKGKGASIEYIDRTQVDVTDAYGTVRNYTLADIAGRKRVTAMLGAVGAPYNNSNIVRWAYDNQMNLLETEQANGTINRYLSHDARGNPGTVVLAANTPQQRTIAYTYHPRINAVLTRTEASVLGVGNKETVFDYDDDYDSVSNQLPTKLPGRIVEKGYTRDATGDIVPYEYITTYTYNNRGQVITVDGPLPGSSDTTTYSYDPTTGDLISVTKALIGETVFSDYDAAGRPGSITDVNNQPATYSYDARARVVETTYSDNSSVYLSYNSAGTLATMTDEDGISRNYTYGADYGRLLRITDALGNYVEYGYDPQGNPVDKGKFDSSDVRSTRAQSTYQHPDIAGRLYRRINPDGTYTQYDYDANGNLASVTDPKGAATIYSHDPLSRVETVTRPGGIITAFGYDGHGNLNSVTDANTNQTTYQYDDMGRVVSTTSPDTGTTTYFYDSAGNTLGQSDANAVAVSYIHDALNRLTAVHFPDAGQNLTFTYDQGTFGMGRLTGMTDPTGVTRFLYDNRGRLVEKIAEISGRLYSVKQSYTSGRRTTSITYPSSRTVDYARNSCVCKIDGVSSTHNGTTHTLIDNLSYRPFAGASGLNNGAGGIVNNAYDEFGRVTVANPGAPKERTYGYDANGNLTGIKALDPVRYSQSFSYDALNRLTGGQGGVYGDIGYTNDDVGNRLTKTINGQTENYTYIDGTNKIEQITGTATTVFSHDANGNIIGIGNRTFVYNQNNRLVRVEQGDSILGEYSYNGLGQRVIKIAGGQTTLFHYDLDGDLIAESDANGIFTVEYLYKDKTLLAKVDVADDKLLFYHNSYLGFPQALADDTNTIVWEGLYRPFGDVLVNPYSSAENNLRMPGQYFDSETGLHYNYNRYYDPKLGRYLQADPIGLAGGINLYTYAQNNPVNAIDPDGRLAWLLPAVFVGSGEAAAGAAAGVGLGVGLAALWDWLWNENTEDEQISCPLGDLTEEEVEQIQKVVDEAGRPLDVVGSSARGERKEGSDIDYVVPPSSLDHYDGLEADLPSIDPNHGVIPGVHNPYQGPSIRFEPGARPKFVPEAR